MPLLFLHLHTCKCLTTCWIHILKYCLRHNGSNIYMPKKYLSATLWETICTHFSHRCWIFSIFSHNKAATFAEYSPYSDTTNRPPRLPTNCLSAANNLHYRYSSSTILQRTLHYSPPHILQFCNAQTARRMGRFIVFSSPPLMFRGWIFISSASINFTFVGVYIYAGTANLPIQLLTACYSDDNKQPLHC